MRSGTVVVACAILVGAAACGGPAQSPMPGTPGSTTPAVTPARSSSGPIDATPTAAGSSALPAFADGEPLLLYSLRTDLGGGVFVMRPDGSGRTQLATDTAPGIYKAPDWSPDGKHVAFIEENAGQVLIAHLDGSATEVLDVCRAGVCDNVAWSPDGTRLAFTRYELTEGVEAPSASEIQVLTLATGAVTTAVRLERPLLADAARWSPDGSQLVIQVDRMDDEAYETGAAIAIVDATGSDPRYIVDFEVFAGEPDWSWATSEIAYSVGLLGLQRTPPDDSVAFDLFAIRPDGTGARQVTNLADGGRLLAPRWTPDGRSLLAKQFDHMAGGGRLVDATTGSVEPFVTGLEETRPLLRPMSATP
jgi:Tol biopolymer transport system component